MKQLDTVTESQLAVFSVLKQFGPLPDVALVPLAQHVMHVSQSSSGIRSRRHELVNFGLVTETGQITTPSGRKAGVFDVIEDYR